MNIRRVKYHGFEKRCSPYWEVPWAVSPKINFCRMVVTVPKVNIRGMVDRRSQWETEWAESAVSELSIGVDEKVVIVGTLKMTFSGCRESDFRF
jgi:hypothetical protein